MPILQARVMSGLLGAIAVAALVGAGQPVAAQESQDAAAAAAGPVGILQVRPDLYMLTVGGSNVAVEWGVNGAIVVDTGPRGTAGEVLRAIRQLTKEPIRFIIDTNADTEYAGNNADLSKAGVSLGNGGFAVQPLSLPAPIIAHANALVEMIRAPVGSAAAYPADALPNQTYSQRQKNFYLNGQAIEMLWQPAAHSDADSVVFFRRSDVVVTGAVFDVTRFPVIDMANGGSAQGEIDALNRLLNLVVPVTPLGWESGGTLVIPGRGRLCEQAELVQYRDMLTIIRDRIQDLIRRGDTLQQIIAANPTAGYTARYGSSTGPWTTGMFVEAMYKSLKGAKK